ncbi:MAG: rRNA ((527)-N(7))-methyltransferase RsmG [Sphingomonas bacterium]|uniref:16S rRNA (guanine(527)-N(7))-methyltransferase RsmG n=1 Tax=Sphingomonas bacterium TaxID=1895847 RepID=UPI00260AD706|nr:16S rRNA (guanine(527)-N(7))-methyltransferase RsmG [Sphingomonas bacterium]MDB5710843.1 rRNA ((527)-N(7))-methyltransferase RsmG [Sphingomonas bacterium]
MTEDEARDWIGERHGAAGVEAMTHLAGLVRDEAARQNLIAPSTLDEIWARHIVDSAQLIPLADAYPGNWLDIGTGAGFPGLVVAALTDRPIWLVEPRKRRADFLSACCDALDVTSRTTVVTGKVERVDVQATVISARAVASLWELLGAARHCSTWNTLWLLPKGRGAREEIASAQQSWHGAFHVEHSVTDPESLIVIAKEVTRR